MSHINVNSFRPADQYIYFANSVDPDETAHNEPSHQDLSCLQFLKRFLTETPICNNSSDQEETM